VIVFGWLAATIVMVAVAATRGARPVVDERRRRRGAHRAFPDAVERVVLLIHAGLTPNLAVRAASRSVPPTIRPAFDAIVHRLDRGVPLGEALDALTDVLGPRAAAVADAFGAADRYGLPLEPMLDQLARDARAERRRLDEADARRLPVRLAFPLVTCTLPSFVLVAIAPAVLAALSSLGRTTQ
jgi:tight adherence protein C